MRMRPVEAAASRERCDLVGVLGTAHGCFDFRSSRRAETNDAREVLAKKQSKREFRTT